MATGQFQQVGVGDLLVADDPVAEVLNCFGHPRSACQNRRKRCARLELSTLMASAASGEKVGLQAILTKAACVKGHVAQPRLEFRANQRWSRFDSWVD